MAKKYIIYSLSKPFYQRKRFMKSIAGAIVMLASSLCFIAAGIAGTSDARWATEIALPCIFAGFVHLIVGLYVIISEIPPPFWKDKPKD